MEIPFVDLKKEYQPIKREILACIEDVLDSGIYIMGQGVEELETQISEYCETKFAVTLNSGTDTLWFSLMALGIGKGDEVIIPSNSFVATANAVLLSGATPVFVDIEANDINIDPEAVKAAITQKTKALIPVHLTGRPARMDTLMSICANEGLVLIEDAAQAFGSTYYGKKIGSMGDVGCFSFHPLKNFNCPGDGGCLVTDSEILASKVKLMRNHGLKDRDTCLFPGYNSRLDVIHAAILKVKLERYEETLKKRLQSIRHYREQLKDYFDQIPESSNIRSVFQNFFIFSQQRDELKKYLADKGVSTSVHSHLIPLHEQPGIKNRSKVVGTLENTKKFQKTTLSIPIIVDEYDKRDYLIDTLIAFKKGTQA